ncbi:hypothetical protein niasHT_014276 [Heterodera trifolii]|uniref:sphinganine-1-phosphate aldolase n=1 Tax=Heterodera trifolii TaxID=157864 RepID=A0ABD2LMP5_9BILA
MISNAQFPSIHFPYIVKINDKLSGVRPLVLVFLSVAGTCFIIKLRNFFCCDEKPIRKRLSAYVFSWLRYLPSVGRKIDEELAKTAKELNKSIHEHDKTGEFLVKLGWDRTSEREIVGRMERYQAMGGHFDFRKGCVSGAVYTDIDSEHMALLGHVFSQFAFSNPLHPDVFPAVRKMEAEIVRMVANLFHGDDKTCGTMTSGGTESIILACLSARNLARVRRGIVRPVVVVPETAHAAFDKACSLLGIHIRHVPVNRRTGRAELTAMRHAIDGNTCLLVGSAPNFPFGTFDDIPSIAKLGLEFKIPVHVDACLGGFLIAFADHSPAFSHLPAFDFTVSGVTSISCDTHKYGYAPKGTSVILYRSPDLLHQQYFCSTEWPGGLYATPTLSGSRPGLNIALTWATLQHFGEKEYARRAHLILQKTAQLADAVAKFPGICLVGTPEVSVVAFSSHRFNIHALGDCLSKMGWNLNFLQNPDALHFCITYNQTADGVLNAFLVDLKKACEEVAALPDRGANSKTAAIYGMAAKIPDKGLVEEVAHLYIDACYSMPSFTSSTN